MKYLLIVSRILDGSLSNLVFELDDEARIYLVGDGVYNIKTGRLRLFLASNDDLEERGIEAEGLEDDDFYNRLIEDLMEWCDRVIFI
jgi:sulfur transfer complex TusBCD TusB component (DsrH family)